MKKLVVALSLVVAMVFSVNAQEKAMMKKSKTVTLVQTEGEFKQQELKLAPGDYVFEIKNMNVGHDVGFVLAPKSNPDAHIKTAYVTSPVKNNTSEKSNVTTLEKGEYVYFCPLNPTPQYTLVVE